MWYGGAGLCGGLPSGGGAPCPGLVGRVVARGWSSGSVGQPRAVSWSSSWRVSVRGPCGVGVAWGLGSPGASCVGLECRNQGGVVVWCLGVSAHRLVGPVVRGAPCMGHAPAIAFAGSAGRWVVASWACCGPDAASAGGEWRCFAGVYRFHGGGGAICSGVGWARGRLPAVSGSQGLTVAGSSAVFPWCVPWLSLVGWLKGVFGVSCIHGGTIVCWRAEAGGAVGCGGGACVGVVHVVGGGASCVVLSSSSWWSVVVVPGGWSWAWRFLGGCGTCGVGLAGGGGRACVGLCVCLLLSPRSLHLPFPCSSLFAGLVCFVFFFEGGRVAGVRRFGCCAWVWVCAGAGAGVGVGVVGDEGRVAVALWVLCVCAGPQASGFQSAGPGGAGGGWLPAVVAWRLRGWSRLLGSAWVAWPGAGVRVGVFMARADGVVGSVGVAGLCGCRVCVRRRRGGLGWGTVGDAMGGGDAGDAHGGASGDAPGGDGVGDADGVIRDGAGAGGGPCGSGGRCRWCSGWWRNW